YGIKVPKGWEQACKDKDHLSHQAWNVFYNYGAAAPFHTWAPSEKDMEWLSAKYPDTFDKYYRPLWTHYAKEQAEGRRFYNQTLPMLCQVCQVPMFFTEPDDPTQIAYRESEYQGMKYHCCSDGCKHIFDNEPEKYAQSWLPVHQIYQGNCFPADVDPTKPDFNPLAEVLRYYKMEFGRDNLDFADSEDKKNFEAWRQQATSN
ncbi:MAG TPA: YHS domain-containing protein, partial [Ottowia sp.]|nr:YHS domain-containing protein [Ottowia sp.]